MGENGMKGKNFGNTSCRLGKGCEIATSIGQNMFDFVKKHQFSKTESCCEVVCICQKTSYTHVQYVLV